MIDATFQLTLTIALFIFALILVSDDDGYVEPETMTVSTVEPTTHYEAMTMTTTYATTTIKVDPITLSDETKAYYEIPTMSNVVKPDYTWSEATSTYVETPETIQAEADAELAEYMAEVAPQHKPQPVYSEQERIQKQSVKALVERFTVEPDYVTKAESMTYRELQAWAKQHGHKANSKRTVLEDLYVAIESTAV